MIAVQYPRSNDSMNEFWDSGLQATSPKDARPEKRGHGSIRQKKKTKIQAKKAAFRESACDDVHSCWEGAFLLLLT